MPVELKVNTQLQRVLDELTKVGKQAADVQRNLKSLGDEIGKGLEDTGKKNEKNISASALLMRRVLQQLKDDFRTLASINAIGQSLKISEQFRGSVKESITLNDTIRKIHSSMGMTISQAAQLESRLVSVFGKIGAGSEAASNAVKGLAETPVRSESALVEYAKTATQLASIGGEKGREGDVAKGLAGVVRAKGGNPDDIGAMQRAADEVMRVRMASGRSATESLSALQGLYSAANPEQRARLAGGGSVSMAAGALAGGQGATAFLERYLGTSRVERQGMEAQGLGRIIGKDGSLNGAAIQSTMREARRRGLGGDAQSGLATMGLGDEEAKGFIRLAEAMEDVQKKSDKARGALINIGDTFEKSKSFQENMMSPVNRVKSMMNPLLNGGITGLNGLMGGAGKSDIGSLLAVGGGGILASLLAGWGMRGAGKALGGKMGGIASGAAVEGITGREVVPVYVTNASEMGGGGLLGSGAQVAGGMGIAGAAAVAAVGAAATGLVLYNANKEQEKFMAPARRAEENLANLPDLASQATKHIRVEVKVDSADPNRFKLKSVENRGTNY